MGTRVDSMTVGRNQDLHHVEQECVPAAGSAVLSGKIDGYWREAVEGIPEPYARAARAFGKKVGVRTRRLKDQFPDPSGIE